MKKCLLGLLIGLPVFLSAQTSITCDSILQTSTCAGGNVIITFQTTGTFPWGNVFTAQLSDNWGNWTNPMVMGTTPFVIGGNGIIFGTIPVAANFGFLYRVRIVSSNPADTSNDSPNTLLVTQVAQLNQIISNPGDSACPGDTITLYALNFASSYLWSTGDTTSSIQVTQPGAYSVTTTDALTCESTAHDTIVFDASLCTGITEEKLNSGFNVFPNPATDRITITLGSHDDLLITITDIAGRRLLTRQSVAEQVEIDISGLAAGSYFVTISSGGVTATRQLIIHE